MKSFRLVAGILIGVMLVAGGMAGFYFIPNFKVAKIDVIGIRDEYKPQIQNILGDQLDKPIWGVSVSNLVSKTLTHRWVESAVVSRKLPNRLKVEIREKTPVAALGDGKGGFQFLDKDNEIIDQASAGQVAGVPLLFGKKLISDSNLRSQGLDIIKSLPEKGILSKEDISEVSFDNEQGFQSRIKSLNAKILLGNKDLTLRIDRARRVAEYLNTNEIEARQIDANYEKKVLVKIKK